MRHWGVKHNVSSIRHIHPREVEHRHREEASLFILDVREAHEYAQGHIPGARLIPLGQLPFRAFELDRQVEVVIVCRSGARSSQATRYLQGQGYRVLNMEGGMLAWQGPVEQGDYQS